MTRVHWLTAFLDLPAGLHDEAVHFWSGVTGYSRSEPRGAHLEFATLVPPRGDAFLRVQRTGPGHTHGVHLDLHVDDPDAAATRAEGLGARVVARPGHVVLRSPGGFAFCLVTEPLRVRPGATRWPHGHESIVDQVALDVPAPLYDAECRFWEALTAWPLHRSSGNPELAHLVRPDGMPIRLLLQRLGPDPRTRVTGHLDLATDDRDAEVARHEQLGARQASEQHGRHWTVMESPTGETYCVTDRDPESGLLD